MSDLSVTLFELVQAHPVLMFKVSLLPVVNVELSPVPRKSLTKTGAWKPDGKGDRGEVTVPLKAKMLDQSGVEAVTELQAGAPGGVLGVTSALQMFSPADRLKGVSARTEAAPTRPRT